MERPLAGGGKQRRGGAGFSGRIPAKWLAGGEGKEGEELEGTSGDLMVASVEVEGGRTGALRGTGAPMAVVGAGGGGPAPLGGGERVGEHRWRAWKLLGGSVREDGGRRRGLHRSRAAAAMKDGCGGAPA